MTIDDENYTYGEPSQFTYWTGSSYFSVVVATDVARISYSWQGYRECAVRVQMRTNDAAPVDRLAQALAEASQGTVWEQPKQGEQFCFSTVTYRGKKGLCEVLRSAFTAVWSQSRGFCMNSDRPLEVMRAVDLRTPQERQRDLRLMHAALLKWADELGVKVDGRWSNRRLNRVLVDHMNRRQG